MARTDYAYTVAYVRAIESRLMTTGDMESLIGQKSADDCMHILASRSYPGIDKAADFEAVLCERYNESYREIEALTPKESPLWLYIIKNDFHNLKACLKSILTGSKDYEKYMIYPCFFDWKYMAELLYKNDFASLPDSLRQAAESAFKILSENGDSRISDSIIDRAYMDYRVDCARENKLDFLEEFYLLSNTMVNIKIAARCAIRGGAGELMEAAISEKSNISKKELIEAALGGQEQLYSYLSSKGFDKEVSLIKKSFADFEKYADAKEGEFMQKANYMTLGIEPVFAYLYALEREVQSLRIIVNSKRKAIDEAIIRQRIRM